jgi:hypothetical protein
MIITEPNAFVAEATAALHDVEEQTERVYVHAILQNLQ